MKRAAIFAVIATLFLLSGCNATKQATRSPETDALFRAATAGNNETVLALLASPGVDVNAVDEHGNTPLIEAARLGHNDVVTALIVIGKANVNAKNDQGKTALMLAAEGGHDETIRALTQAGALK